MLAREQQRHIDRHAGEDGFLNRGQALFGAGNLDEQVGSSGPGVQVLGHRQRARGVVGQQRRHFQRDPSVHAVRPVVYGSKQIGRLGKVLDGQLQKERLARLALPELVANPGVVGRAVLDGVVEDRWVGRQPSDRQLLDIALERAAGQQFAGNVIEPQALAQVMKYLRSFHTIRFIQVQPPAPR